MDELFAALSQSGAGIRLYLVLCEDANQAVVLERLVYWQGRAALNAAVGVAQRIDGSWWIGAGLVELSEDCGLSLSACRKALDQLVSRGWLLRRMKARDGVLVTHWRVVDALASALVRSRAFLFAASALERRLVPSSSSRARADILYSLSLGSESTESESLSLGSGFKAKEKDSDSDSGKVEFTSLRSVNSTHVSDILSSEDSCEFDRLPGESKDLESKSLGSRARARKKRAENDYMPESGVAQSSRRNPTFDAVARHLFNANPDEIRRAGGRMAIIANWLDGKIDSYSVSGKRTVDLMGKNDPPVKPEYIDARMRDFVAWYKRRYPEAALPLAPEKFITHWRAFKTDWMKNHRQRQNSAPVSPTAAPSYQPGPEELQRALDQLRQSDLAPELRQTLEKTG